MSTSESKPAPSPLGTKTHWANRAGELIEIISMETSYLVNLDKYLRRRVSFFRQMLLAETLAKQLELLSIWPSYCSDGTYDALSSEDTYYTNRRCHLSSAPDEEILSDAVPCWKLLQAQLKFRLASRNQHAA